MATPPNMRHPQFSESSDLQLGSVALSGYLSDRIAQSRAKCCGKPVVANYYAITNLGDGATEILVPTLPNGRQCFCPGDVATYTCTVVGGSVTVWSGTVFDCPGSNNRISLVHSLFSGEEGEAGECSIPSGVIRSTTNSKSIKNI